MDLWAHGPWALVCPALSIVVPNSHKESPDSKRNADELVALLTKYHVFQRGDLHFPELDTMGAQGRLKSLKSQMGPRGPYGCQGLRPSSSPAVPSGGHRYGPLGLDTNATASKGVCGETRDGRVAIDTTGLET